MVSELERLVDLVPFLKARPGIRVEEVAETFGVTPKRILSDLAILQFVGLPGGLYGDLFDVDIDGARSDGHIFVRNVDALGRPMRLTHDQVASLIVALQVVMEMGGDDSAAKSALAKLKELSLGAEPPVSVAVQSGDAEVRAALNSALEEGRAVRLTYRPGGRGATRTAVVEPARLRADSGYVYLDAWSRDREAWRSYRVERVERAELLDERTTPREVPGHLDSWFGDVTHTLTVVVRPRGRWCADYYPTTAVREVEDGLELTFPLVSDEWGARLLLSLGEDAVRVSNADVAELARSRARAALERYGA